MTFNYKEIASLDYFDSRDVVERLSEIDNGSPTTVKEKAALIRILDELEEEFPVSEYSDVRTDMNCGVQGFAEHYAIEYAEEYASDVAGMDREQPWPFNHIDWEAAADALKEDCTEVEILGSTFYLRD